MPQSLAFDTEKDTNKWCDWIVCLEVGFFDCRFCPPRLR
jgi:hypothetical protein